MPLPPRKKAPPPKAYLVKQRVKQTVLSSVSVASHSAKTHVKTHLNGSAHNETLPKPSRTPTPSRPSSKEPVERLKAERARVRPSKRASPTITTPQFSDDDEEEVEAQPKKRAKLSEVVDPNRQIKDVDAFVENEVVLHSRIHAREIANSDIIAHSGRNSYEPFFTAFTTNEDPEEAVITTEYPAAASEPEEWHIVVPVVNKSDFHPHEQITKNMEVMRDYYLDEDSKRIVDNINGSGLLQALNRVVRRKGTDRFVGARTDYISIISQYNELIRAKRADGAFSAAIDRMQSIPFHLMTRILSETCSRTVSPSVESLSKYTAFSDNVYGELLPPFLSRIFKETGLRSDQVFVDLGSGVGNCVIQAALETGCTAWGCEMMDSPARLAAMQAKEFRVRCKLWGFKAGPVNLIHDDFLQNQRIGEVLKKADVILLNNQAFTAELNDKLKFKFLDVKEGAKIVSLKYFRDPKYRIKDTTINDPINVLTVVEKERFSNNVSWSSDPGKWYLHTKDSSELQAFQARMYANAGGGER
jgi:[histone H3]-lysine79 N-trimethyltransferase